MLVYELRGLESLKAMMLAAQKDLYAWLYLKIDCGATFVRPCPKSYQGVLNVSLLTK